MDDPFWLYVLFNRCEAATWFAGAFALPFLVKGRRPRQKLATAAASLGFILTCRFIYFGKFNLRDRYFHFGLACLAAATGVMILQHYLYGM